MKYQTNVNCDQEKFFDAISKAFIDGYKQQKGKEPTMDQLTHGLSYQLDVTHQEEKHRATMKVLKYDRPNQLSIEYKSPVSHQIESWWLEKDGNELKVTKEKIEETIQNGKVIKVKGNDHPEVTKKMPLLKAIEIKRLANDVRYGNQF